MSHVLTVLFVKVDTTAQPQGTQALGRKLLRCYTGAMSYYLWCGELTPTVLIDPFMFFSETWEAEAMHWQPEEES